ncbi:MAG: glycosyltransferase [Pseudomonadota bacterium]
MSFTKAVVRNRGEHDVFLALNGLLADSVMPIRREFAGILPSDRIRVWHAPGPVSECLAGNDERRLAAELLREDFLRSLQPDVIHISSLFEGYVDNAVTSIGAHDSTTAVTVSFFDLIPLLHRAQYLDPHPLYERFYTRKLSLIPRASKCLSISAFSANDGRKHLQLPADRFVNVSTAVDTKFRPIEIEPDTKRYTLGRLGIERPFVLYTGGADERKNIAKLVFAYAKLPEELRSKHQLILVGKLPAVETRAIEGAAASAGLTTDEIRLCGYVDDDQLIRLYNLCELFVMPSLYEGFGLPVLEAMRCGAPVIASNSSSLPEVLGCEEALFDPENTDAIRDKMAAVLTSGQFRARLVAHGKRHAARFSWDHTARSALDLWETLPRPKPHFHTSSAVHAELLINRLSRCLTFSGRESAAGLAACLAQNQISGMERQLLIDVSGVMERDSPSAEHRFVVACVREILHHPPAGLRAEPVYAVDGGDYMYAERFAVSSSGVADVSGADRPIRWQRGDVFLGLSTEYDLQVESAELYRRLRDDGVVVRFCVYDLSAVELSEQYEHYDDCHIQRRWLSIVTSCDGAIVLTKTSADVFRNWLDKPPHPVDHRFTITHLRPSVDKPTPARASAPDVQGADLVRVLASRPSFATVSNLEPHRGQAQILDAFELLWSEGFEANLVFIGKPGLGVEELAERIQGNPQLGRRLFWFCDVDDALLDTVYRSSACAVAASLSDGCGLSVLEAASRGLPLILRDIPVYREVAGDHAQYFTGAHGSVIATVVKKWMDRSATSTCPKPYDIALLDEQEFVEGLQARVLGAAFRPRQLLVDVSELVRTDAGAGIQRVVRSILQNWRLYPPEGLRVETVYASQGDIYRYAKHFGSPGARAHKHWQQKGDPIEYAPGDVFLGLDFQPVLVASNRDFFRQMRVQGVEVRFIVYDMLQARMPEYFPAGASTAFMQWLEVVGESDGAVCISESVANEFDAWLRESHEDRSEGFDTQWFHLGADINEPLSDSSMAPPNSPIEKGIDGRKRFLMVGTIEPRKGHTIVLDAFEILWAAGATVELHIVGKQGWLVEALARRIRGHSEFGEKLFWHSRVEDHELEAAYRDATCLIAASEGEGFGLPIVEAARHGLPVIARDIPIFREIAGTCAHYFDVDCPEALAERVRSWICLFEQSRHPRVEGVELLTWRESASQLERALNIARPYPSTRLETVPSRKV